MHGDIFAPGWYGIDWERIGFYGMFYDKSGRGFTIAAGQVVEEAGEVEAV
ncbi:hypothetical protein [Desmospora profundinema]|uniref:Uncharacterized protein n=1 Tax=Desmospora profundinema TaxID=1571184 RepID=A0ABU1IRC7_9BACL|nr:hypothetical protein [Desmospora profundinema]MDR6226300.1 hypothetical protein [Desmospora profundinema]